MLPEISKPTLNMIQRQQGLIAVVVRLFAAEQALFAIETFRLVASLTGAALVSLVQRLQALSEAVPVVGYISSSTSWPLCPAQFAACRPEPVRGLGAIRLSPSLCVQCLTAGVKVTPVAPVVAPVGKV